MNPSKQFTLSILVLLLALLVIAAAGGYWFGVSKTRAQCDATLQDGKSAGFTGPTGSPPSAGEFTGPTAPPPSAPK